MLITNIHLYRAIVIKSAIGLYLKSGKRLIPNRAYTPANMLRAASEITGKEFKRGQHEQAFVALGQHIEVAKLKGETLQDEVRL
jgi:hypothetical protein